MEEEIKQMFVYGELQGLGTNGYSDFIRSRREIKERRQAMIRAQIRKRQQFVEYVFYIIVFLVSMGFVGWLAVTILQWGRAAGKW